MNAPYFGNSMRIKHKIREIFFLIIVCFGMKDIKAQITFPNGNTLNLNSGNELMYLETRILFQTGKFKASDYRWSKIYDSLDSRWFVTSCFNGDCRNELLQSGNFVTDFGIKDTLCFIAFHVETKGISGYSKIRYRVYNTKLPSDSADLVYNITYTNTLKIESSFAQGVIISNPVSQKIQIQNLSEQPEKIILIDLNGALKKQWDSFELISGNLLLPMEQYMSGYYLLYITYKHKTFQQKLFLENR